MESEKALYKRLPARLNGINGLYLLHLKIL